MTLEKAIARFRARWAHPPDPRDVAERVAIRYRDADLVPVTVASVPPAVRLFRIWLDDADIRERKTVSAYVHRLGEVDQVLDRLEQMAADDLAKHEAKLARKAAA